VGKEFKGYRVKARVLIRTDMVWVDIDLGVLAVPSDKLDKAALKRLGIRLSDVQEYTAYMWRANKVGSFFTAKHKALVEKRLDRVELKFETVYG